MICGTCGRDNPGHLTFCEECGQRLAPRVAPPTPPVGLAQPSFVPSRTVPLTPPQQPQPSQVAQQPPTFGAAPPAALRPAAPDVRFAPRTSQQPAPTTPEQIRCTTCGSTNQRGLRFCVACGQQLEGAQPATQPHVHPLSPAAHTVPQPIVQPQQSSVQPPQPIAHAPQAAIAPARVVDLGGPPIVKSSARVCARCRGTCDANAQFCKFCGAPLGDPTAPLAASPPPQAPSAPVSRESAVPDTPPIDPRAYRPFQAMSAASSNAGAPANQAASSASTARAPVDPRAETGLMSAVAIAPTAVRGRIVIIARDGGEGPSFPLAEITDVGRTEGNVLLAEDRYISPRHARITRRGDVVTLRDLGSVNGIYLRIPVGTAAGLSVPPPPVQTPNPSGAHAAHGAMAVAPATSVVLEDQDLFLVGQQVLRFEVVNDAEEGFGTASQHGTLLFGTPAAPRYARLSQRTVEGVTRDVFYIRKVETVLGRESGDIVFTEDPFLSRRHAAIHYDRDVKGHGRFNLADLGSSNGTFLQIREEVRLKDGDHFRIGQQLFRIDLESAGPTAGAPQMAAPRS